MQLTRFIITLIDAGLRLDQIFTKSFIRCHPNTHFEFNSTEHQQKDDPVGVTALSSLRLHHRVLAL